MYPLRAFIMDVWKNGLTNEAIERHKENFHRFAVIIDTRGKYIEMVHSIEACFLDFEQEKKERDGNFLMTDESFSSTQLLLQHRGLFAYFKIACHEAYKAGLSSAESGAEIAYMEEWYKERYDNCMKD